MKALLRFQAVLAARLFASPLVALILVLVYVLAGFAERNAGYIGRSLTQVSLLVAAPLVLWAMTQSADALDAVRWSSPLRPRQVVAAHLLFWTAACVMLSLPIAAIQAVAGGPWALVPLDAVLLGTAAAAASLVLQRVVRRPDRPGWMAASAIAVFGIGPTVSGMTLTLVDRQAFGLVLHAVAMAVLLAIAVPVCLRDERLPAASTTDGARTGGPPQRRARSPAATISTGDVSVVFAGCYAVFAVAFQLLPGGRSDIGPIMFPVVATVMLGSSAARSSRWLLASPIDRRRLFRILYLPVLLVSVACAATRFCALEFRSDRTVFFDGRGGPRHRDALLLGDMLEVDAEHHVYLPPRVDFIAARARDELASRFALDVPQERIAATIRRGWDEMVARHGSPGEQEAIFDAMARLRADLADEIVAADRRRNALNALALVLVCTAFLCEQSFVFRRWWIHMVFTIAFVGTLTSVWDHILLAFGRASPPVAALVVLGAVVVAISLWKLAERRFRQLDLTDLPAPTNAWGWPKST